MELPGRRLTNATIYDRHVLRSIGVEHHSFNKETREIEPKTDVSNRHTISFTIITLTVAKGRRSLTA